jgi:proteasome lid subunit RPN8/RPN11
MNLTLNEASRSIMEAHAIGSFPNECCGFFFGKNNGESRTVTDVFVVKNAKEGDQRRRFSIAPLDYMRAEQEALARGLDLLGIYHSHPLHPAVPSEHDLAQALPTFSYIILQVEPGQIIDLRSWQLNEAGAFVEETIQTTVST